MEQRQPVRDEPVIVGRYAIYDRIAAGGMATVHLGRLVGERGFSRTVAIKRLHPHLAMDPDFVGMFLDEARLAARIRHPNVVQMLDVVARRDEVFLVMEYVEGESLSQFMRLCIARGDHVPPSAAVALMANVLRGLHAAHEAKNDQGEPLGLVHRDVSPQNVLIDLEGIARVLDFGVAKALGQSHSTRDGQLKGKLAYMAPEQITGGVIDRRTDIFAAAVVMWEMLCSRRLFKADGDAQVMHLVMHDPIKPPSTFAPDLPPALDAVVLRALERDPTKRYDTAAQMADALEDALAPMPPRKLGPWVSTLLSDNLALRARLVHEIESRSTGQHAIPAALPRFNDDVIDLDLMIDGAATATASPAPVGSQASSIAVAAPRSPTPLPPQKSSSRTLVMVGAIACVVVLVAGLAVRTLRQPPPVTASSPPVPAEVTATPPEPAAAPPPTGTPPPTMAAENLPLAEPLPSASAPEPAKPTTHATFHPAHPAAPTAPAPSAKLYSRF